MKSIALVTGLLSILVTSTAYGSEQNWRSVTGSSGFFLIDNGTGEHINKCSEATHEAQTLAYNDCRSEKSYIVEQLSLGCKKFFGTTSHTLKYRCASDQKDFTEQTQADPVPAAENTMFSKLSGNSYTLVADRYWGGYSEKCSPHLVIKNLGSGRILIKKDSTTVSDGVKFYNLNNNGTVLPRHCSQWGRANRSCFVNELMIAKEDHVKITALIELEDKRLGIIQTSDSTLLEMIDLGDELIYKNNTEDCTYKLVNHSRSSL